MNNNPNQNQKLQDYDVDEIINKLLQSRKYINYLYLYNF